MKPTGELDFKPSVWSIQYSQEVRRPSVDAYIRFYSNSTNEMVHEINVHTNLDNVTYSNKQLNFATAIHWNMVIPSKSPID